MMDRKTAPLFFIVLAISFFAVLPAGAKIDLVTLRNRQSVQTTIYNKADLTLVRDKRRLSFVKGINRLQFSWANTKIDPTSLSLEIKNQTNKIDVVEIAYPPGIKDVGIWKLKAEQACQVPVEISYFTSGISWKSYYIAMLSKDQKTCELNGYVKVTNTSGEDYHNASTRLVVGEINILDKIAQLASLQYPYGRPEYLAGRQGLKNMYIKGKKEIEFAQPMMVMDSTMADSRPKEIRKQGISEYFLYTIEGEETIPNGWSKRLLSFKAEGINVKTVYKYEAERFDKNVIRFITFKNDKENNLGQTPLPGGEVNVFHRINETGALDFMGSDSTKYIPVNKKVELNLGSTLSVKIVPKVMAITKKNITFDTKGNINGFDEVKTVELALSNFTDMISTLEYVKNLDSPHFKINHMTHPDSFEKIDQDTIKFTIELGPHSNNRIAFTLTTRRGERRWQQ